ncbi:MAG: T9SS type A sorting domain-containing protein [Bacteroidota bacterium]
MKIKIYFLFILGWIYTFDSQSQEVVSIPGGAQNGGLLESTINTDDAAVGTDRIYELERGQFYLMHAGINVDNPGGSITIRAEEGDGPLPVIVMQPLNEVNVTPSVVKSSLYLESIQWQVMPTNRAWIGEALIDISGVDCKLDVRGCFFETAHGLDAIFKMADVESGAVAKIRDSYFRDMDRKANWWSGRVIDFRSTMADTIIFENNTVTGSQLTILQNNALCDFALINHNTFINGSKYPFLNVNWKTLFVTNNLFVNVNWTGEDFENVASGGQDPDALLMGLVGLDTITNAIELPDRYLDGQGNITSELDDFSDLVWYAADNVVVHSATLDNYYNGGLNDNPDFNAPESYLTWNQEIYGSGPFQVRNVPAIWMNERTTELVNDYDNIISENNSLYEMSIAELGLGTEPMPQDVADVYIQFNRHLYGVPGVTMPTDEEFLITYFGDYDPNTIPGVGGENSKEGGIVLFSDLTEDFSYTANLVSQSDGLPIGSLLWDDKTYDFDASFESIQSVYSGGALLDVDEISLITSTNQNNYTGNLQVQCYPNPAREKATIRFSLQTPAHVNLSIYDLTGKLVVNLVNEQRPAGMTQTEFVPSEGSNVYIYRLTTGNYSKSGLVTFTQ